MRSGGRETRAYTKPLSWTAAVVGALAWVGAAPAATPPPPEDVPAVSAYVELIPTSRGSEAPVLMRGRRGRLPPRVEAALEREAGDDAPLLREVATSPRYGAPEPRQGPVPRLPLEPEPEPALSTAVAVVTDGDDRRLLGLGLAMLAITLVAVAGLLYERRPVRTPQPR